ncbi:MAG: hypothetical protein KDK70_10280 [Myxococcales bacterium]|nr:hypothetical protein [Myxococcales bacterium]
MARPTQAPRWPGQLTARGLLALRVWMFMVVATLGLGLGSWPEPSSAPRLAEHGLRTGHHGPIGPGELPEGDLPVRGESEGEDAKDAKDAKDAQDPEHDHRRRPVPPALALAPALELTLTPAAAWRSHGDARHVGPGSSHPSRLHNRGPPLA